MRKVVPFLCLVALSLGACTPAASVDGPAALPADRERIRPSAENPRFWEYGRTVLLIGGSDVDNLFQWTGIQLTDQLDLLASVGGNYVRNTMTSRRPEDVWQFHRLEDGRYDLERPNPEYYARLEALLREAHGRDIIVQIELWDRFDFYRRTWEENPFRPDNNVNYTVEESGLANEYPQYPASNANPIFRTVPANEDNRTVLRYQHAHIDRLLEVSLRYPNVLYTMDNETRGTEEWAAYWSRYVQRRASEAGVDAYTTEMWGPRQLRHELHRRTLDHPDLYGFVEISQGNHNRGEEHWDDLQWIREYLTASPRPLNNVKIYGADMSYPLDLGYNYCCDQDAVERFWRSILGGAASVRFHRPPAGIGLSGRAQRHIRSARMLLAEFDVFRAVPDAAHARLSGREENGAYLSYVEGEGYAVYVPDGGAVGLDLGAAAGQYTLRWLDVAASRWQEGSASVGAGPVQLRTPGPGAWVALITRR